MPLFTQPGDRAIDGLFAGLGQLTAMMGWLTVAVGMSTLPTLLPLALAVPGAGFIAGMLAVRAWTGTLVAEVVALAACAALAPEAQAWVWLGALILGVGRALGFVQRRRAASGS